MGESPGSFSELTRAPGPQVRDDRLALVVAKGAALLGRVAADRALDPIELGDRGAGFLGDRSAHVQPPVAAFVPPRRPATSPSIMRMPRSK
jgi:hypothetical protein